MKKYRIIENGLGEFIIQDWDDIEQYWFAYDIFYPYIIGMKWNNFSSLEEAQMRLKELKDYEESDDLKKKIIKIHYEDSFLMDTIIHNNYAAPTNRFDVLKTGISGLMKQREIIILDMKGLNRSYHSYDSVVRELQERLDAIDVKIKELVILLDAKETDVIS